MWRTRAMSLPVFGTSGALSGSAIRASMLRSLDTSMLNTHHTEHDRALSSQFHISLMAGSAPPPPYGQRPHGTWICTAPASSRLDVPHPWQHWISLNLKLRHSTLPMHPPPDDPNALRPRGLHATCSRYEARYEPRYGQPVAVHAKPRTVRHNTPSRRPFAPHT